LQETLINCLWRCGGRRARCTCRRATRVVSSRRGIAHTRALAPSSPPRQHIAVGGPMVDCAAQRFNDDHHRRSKFGSRIALSARKARARRQPEPAAAAEPERPAAPTCPGPPRPRARTRRGPAAGPGQAGGSCRIKNKKTNSPGATVPVPREMAGRNTEAPSADMTEGAAARRCSVRSLCSASGQGACLPPGPALMGAASRDSPSRAGARGHV